MPSLHQLFRSFAVVTMVVLLVYISSALSSDYLDRNRVKQPDVVLRPEHFASRPTVQKPNWLNPQHHQPQQQPPQPPQQQPPKQPLPELLDDEEAQEVSKGKGKFSSEEKGQKKQAQQRQQQIESDEDPEEMSRQLLFERERQQRALLQGLRPSSPQQPQSKLGQQAVENYIAHQKSTQRRKKEQEANNRMDDQMNIRLARHPELYEEEEERHDKKKKKGKGKTERGREEDEIEPDIFDDPVQKAIFDHMLNAHRAEVAKHKKEKHAQSYGRKPR